MESGSLTVRLTALGLEQLMVRLRFGGEWNRDDVDNQSIAYRRVHNRIGPVSQHCTGYGSSTRE